MSQLNRESLDRATTKLEAVLDEIKQSQVEFAAIRTELNLLHEDVKGLSRIVRDNGDKSLLTKIALLEQKITDILNWQDKHRSLHQKVQGEIGEITDDIEDVQRELMLINKQVEEHDGRFKKDEEAQQKELNNKLELAHEEQLSLTKVKEERQKFFIKVIAAFVIATFTFAAGYLLK